jgi:hypothetical protein
MTATAHALVSAAIASSVQNPILAIPLAFVSHFVLDVVPHWDFGTNWRSRAKAKTGAVAIFDTVLGFSLAYFLFAGKVEGSLLFWCMVAGNLPDWMEAPYYIFFAKQNKKNPDKNASFWENLTYAIYKLENVFHAKAQAPFGIITQVVAVGFFLLLLNS